MGTRVRCLLPIALLWIGVAAIAGRAGAAPARTPVGAPNTAIPLARLLRADGTLDLRGAYRGSVATAGWRMVAGAGGAPRFVQEGTEAQATGMRAPLATQDAADINWDSRFDWKYGADGGVWAAVVDGSGNLYIGGTFFSVYGVAARGVAKWDGSNWSALGSGMDSNVLCLAMNGTALYAGGDFSTAGGVSASCIAKWDGSSWSALGLGMNSFGAVRALAFDGSGNVYAGGDFSTAGGGSASHIARWDGANWTALGAGTDGSVYSLAVDAASLYVGGFFSNAGGSSASNIAKWNGASWSALAGGTENTVEALATDGSGNLYAGGLFVTADGGDANHIAKWNGTSWSALGAGLSLGTFDEVRALTMDGSGNLYVGGYFTTAGGGSANALAVWNGSSWSALGSGATNGVLSLARHSDGTLYAVGAYFPDGGGDIAAGSIAKWNGSSWVALTSGSGLGMDGAIIALAHDGGGNVYASGFFGAAGNRVAPGVARWNGSSWAPLGGGPDYTYYFSEALAADGNGHVYLGGVFGEIDGVSANHIAEWDGTSWSAMGSGLGNVGLSDLARALAVDDGGNLFAGGTFSTAGDGSANNVARWDGASWSALGTGVDGDVQALVVDGNGNLYAGGSFLNAGGVSANRIAKWDGTNWSALGTGMNNTVRALAVDGTGNVYAGGQFTNAGGHAANRVAKWNGTTWTALGTGVNTHVYALAVDSDGNLYAGGDFGTAGGASANHVAKWNGTAWSAMGSGVDFPVTTSHYVQALTINANNDVYVGGSFITAGNKPSAHFATWLAPPVLHASAGAGGSISPSGNVSLARGGDQTFTITPDANYHVNDVQVDGASVGAVTSYTFTNVLAAHTIAATFAPGNTGVESGPVTDFALAPVAPNPSHGSVWIDYALPREARARLSVIDLQGRTVATLANGVREPGRYRVAWDSRSALGHVSTGMYFVRLEVPGIEITRRALIVR